MSLGDVLAVVDVANRLKDLAEVCINRSKDLAAFNKFLINTAQILLGFDAVTAGLPEAHGLLGSTLSDILVAVNDCANWMKKHSVFHAPSDKKKCAEIEERIQKRLPVLSIAGMTFTAKKAEVAASESKQRDEELKKSVSHVEVLARDGLAERRQADINSHKAHMELLEKMRLEAEDNVKMHRETQSEIKDSRAQNFVLHISTWSAVKDGFAESKTLELTTQAKVDALTELMRQHMTVQKGQEERDATAKSAPPSGSVRFYKPPEQFFTVIAHLLNPDSPSGIIVHGSPGLGKSLMASSLSHCFPWWSTLSMAASEQPQMEQEIAQAFASMKDNAAEAEGASCKPRTTYEKVIFMPWAPPHVNTSSASNVENSNAERIQGLVATLARRLGCDIEGEQCLNNVCEKIWDRLNEQHYLVIIDDVWKTDMDIFSQISNGINISALTGSRVVLTSRHKPGDWNDVEIIHLDHESNKPKCMEIFKAYALNDGTGSKNLKQKFQACSEKLVAECDGLPLMIKVVAGMVRDLKDPGDWEDVLGRLQEAIKTQRDSFLDEDSNLQDYKRPLSAYKLSVQDLRDETKRLLLTLTHLNSAAWVPVGALRAMWECSSGCPKEVSATFATHLNILVKQGLIESHGSGLTHAISFHWLLALFLNQQPPQVELPGHIPNLDARCEKLKECLTETEDHRKAFFVLYGTSQVAAVALGALERWGTGLQTETDQWWNTSGKADLSVAANMLFRIGPDQAAMAGARDIILSAATGVVWPGMVDGLLAIVGTAAPGGVLSGASTDISSLLKTFVASTFHGFESLATISTLRFYFAVLNLGEAVGTQYNVYDLAQLANKAGLVCEQLEWYPEALALYQASLLLYWLLPCENNIGRVCSSLGRFDTARKLHSLSYASRKLVCGSTSLETVNVMESLAQAYYDEASELPAGETRKVGLHSKSLLWCHDISTALNPEQHQHGRVTTARLERLVFLNALAVCSQLMPQVPLLLVQRTSTSTTEPISEVRTAIRATIRSFYESKQVRAKIEEEAFAMELGFVPEPKFDADEAFRSIHSVLDAGGKLESSADLHEHDSISWTLWSSVSSGDRTSSEDSLHPKHFSFRFDSEDHYLLGCSHISSRAHALQGVALERAASPPAYLCADSFSRLSLWEHIQSGEMWRVLPNADGTVALQSCQYGTHLSALDDGSLKHMGARRSQQKWFMKPVVLPQSEASSGLVTFCSLTRPSYLSDGRDCVKLSSDASLSAHWRLIDVETRQPTRMDKILLEPRQASTEAGPSAMTDAPLTTPTGASLPLEFDLRPLLGRLRTLAAAAGPPQAAAGLPGAAAGSPKAADGPSLTRFPLLRFLQLLALCCHVISLFIVTQKFGELMESTALHVHSALWWMITAGLGIQCITAPFMRPDTEAPPQPTSNYLTVAQLLALTSLTNLSIVIYLYCQKMGIMKLATGS